MNWEQAVNETVSLAIESSMSNLNGSMNVSTNKTTVDPNARFSTKIPQESNAINLGPILGPCLLFVIVLLYLYGKRIEQQEEKERAQEANKGEDNKRQFLKNHINVKVSPHVFDSSRLSSIALIVSNRYTNVFRQYQYNSIETLTKDHNQMKRSTLHPVLFARQIKT